MRLKAGLPVPGQADAEPAAVAPVAEAEDVPVAAAAAAPAADPMAEVPAELLNKPFKDLSKEERVLVARARSRAMRMKAGLLVPGAAEGAPAPAAPEDEADEPVADTAVAASDEEAGDPMADVPADLLNKPFKELTKEERIIVARARSRAVRAKAGKPVGGADA